MNIKKTPGANQTDPDDLSAYVADHKKELWEQFQKYSPDLIVCCGGIISSSLKQIEEFADYLSVEGNTTRDGIWWEAPTGKAPWITYMHPEAHVPDNLLTYDLIDAVREVMEK